MKNFNMLPRADTFTLENDHDLYRVYRVPGLRSSRSYDGSGVKDTYNMIEADASFPADEEAVPVLAEIRLPNGANKKVIRKSVEHDTVTCGECDVPMRRNQVGETFCPKCGLMAGGQEIDRSPDSAGRYENEG